MWTARPYVIVTEVNHFIVNAIRCFLWQPDMAGIVPHPMFLFRPIVAAK